MWARTLGRVEKKTTTPRPKATNLNICNINFNSQTTISQSPCDRNLIKCLPKSYHQQVARAHALSICKLNNARFILYTRAHKSMHSIGCISGIGAASADAVCARDRDEIIYIEIGKSRSKANQKKCVLWLMFALLVRR